jgi:hypothetical protein
MKSNIAVTTLALLLAVSSVQAQKQQTISESQCRQIFMSADDYQNRRTSDGMPYCEVYSDRDDDPRMLLGYVFLKTLALADKETALLIGVDTYGKIVKVNTTEPTAIAEEFLAQFEGKNLTSSFEVVKTAEDLMHVPSKIKAIRDNVEMSERIAKTVHETLDNSLTLALGK